MGRGTGSRRWIAVSGGVLINGLLLGALALVERLPASEDTPPMLVELERPDRPRTSERRIMGSSGGAVSSRSMAAAPLAASGDAVASDTAPAEPAPPIMDPAWRVDPGAVDRWRLLEGNAALGVGRFKRACAGLTSEHMTDEEKDRCYGGWYDKPTTKRPSPQFIGPIDERKWEAYERAPPPPNDKEFRRQEHCKAYRKGRVGADPSTMPSIREGGCF